MAEGFKNKYALPDCVVIKLEEVSFHVRLPTSAHRQFERAIADVFTEPQGEPGKFRRVPNVTLEQMFIPMHKAFFRTCVVNVEGLDDYDPETFVDTYPAAAEELYEQACQLASEVEKEAVEQVGKSLASSPGQISGQGEDRSTTVSLNVAG